MIHAHLGSTSLDPDPLARVIETVTTCAQTCTACADASLSEEMVADRRRCIRSDLDCADICDATARVLSRLTSVDTQVTRAQLDACITACQACGDECERHAEMHEHCRIWTEACRACEAACSELADAIR
ncbi:four-helix bundle copper-binding protein [Cellulomonas fimi]|uniref:Ferredoxin n=1 Tax=Cellulomonas fimi (strain ATCC 484 / DSM 20113 / JCM 1341 / CCUG 24087 / LMG 16345 / NBRC 15513 / NCIMB 8980 / NCTC 7547 / NRS-133) TaxID=590998 RepID=F4H0T2_CELFA|nr:four-helix bundle copper-binding protein [Cellulomonas fimi]AEE46179.1 protein of unknown function DUF326 [Cellulomonas fimi ATCC 484]NNH07033.1 four-helix bundle copper-binding protein [Cellulomonas fimi]VEH31953.1 Domain of Uncharacterised Function (DUF326) [Cellulomonas fimi]